MKRKKGQSQAAVFVALEMTVGRWKRQLERLVVVVLQQREMKQEGQWTVDSG